MFVVMCPKCEKQSKAFVDHAGLRGKCPHCGKKIAIKAAVDAVLAENLPQIVPQANGLLRKRRQRPHLPDTSPPAVPLAFVALLPTWLFFFLGNSYLADQEAWKIITSCLWVGKVEVFAFFWGLFLILWKAGLWMLQRRPLSWNVLPDRFSGDTRVGPSDVPLCQAHLYGLASRPQRSILLNRVHLALEHFRQTRNVQDVRGALTGQSAIDANLLDSSYTVLRFLIWVIPILGFIGTVVGIGIAVNKFADVIPSVSEIEKAMTSLRAGLGQVTTGLGTAFNTTLVGLLLVTPLMLMTSWLRKLEEHLLAQIDQFSNHNLLGTLDDRT